MKSFTLKRCDGSLFSLDEVCGAPATNIYFYSRGCGTCVWNVKSEMTNRMQEFSDDGLRGIVVITTDSNWEPPSAATCQLVEDDAAGTGIIVVYDENQTSIPDYNLWSSSWDKDVVLDEFMNIQLIKQYASGEEIDSRIEQLVNPT